MISRLHKIHGEQDSLTYTLLLLLTTTQVNGPLHLLWYSLA